MNGALDMSDSIPAGTKDSVNDEKTLPVTLEADCAQKIREKLLGIIKNNPMPKRSSDPPKSPKKEPCANLETDSYWGEISGLENFSIDGKELILKEIALEASEKNHFDAAIKIVQLLASDYQKDKTLRRIAQKQLELRNAQGALHTCYLIKYGKNRVKLLSNIAILLARKKDKIECTKTIDAALLLVKELMEYEKPEFFYRIALAQAIIGDLETAIKTSKLISDPIIKTAAYCDTALELFYHIEDSEAQKIMIRAYNLAKETKNHNYKRFSLRSSHFSRIVNPLGLVAETQNELLHFKKALNSAMLLELNKERGTYLNNALENGLVRGKNYLLCKVCAEQSYLEELADVTVRPKTLLSISKMQAFCGNFSSALKTAELIDWDLDYVKALVAIGEVFAADSQVQLAKNQFDRAADIVANSKLIGFDFFLKDLAKAYASIEDFDLAINVTYKMRNLRLRAETLAEVSRQWCYEKGLKVSQKAFLQAVDAAIIIEDSNSRIQMIAKVALETSLGGNEDFARRFFNLAFEVAQTSEKESDKLFSMLNVAFIQANSNNPEAAQVKFREARTFASSLQGGKFLINVAVKQAEAGFEEDALRTAQPIKNPKELVELAAVFASRSYLDGFRQVLVSGVFDMDTMGKMCIFLVKILPDQAESIAEIVNKIYVNAEKNNLSEFKFPNLI
jgi:hypothetical protein